MATKYTVQSDGRWATNVWDGTYVNGKKHYIRIRSAKSSRDLELKVEEYKKKFITGQITHNQEALFYDYAVEWVATAKSMREVYTQRMYNNVINTHLVNYPFRFEEFSVSVIQKIFNDLKDKPRLCQQVKLTIKQIGESAEYDKLLPMGKTKEVLSKVNLPKYKAKERQPLTDHEKEVLFKAPFSPKQRAFVFTLYYCGLRREEALALTLNDVKDGFIDVNKAVIFNENDYMVKDTKSERGNRRVPIPKPLQAILDEYIAFMGFERPNQALFPQQDKISYMSKMSYTRHWNNIRDALSLVDGGDYSRITAHVFRHNYCTMLCYQAAENHNITTKKIAELLGDSEKMVIEIYSHIIEERENVDDALENAFG